MQIVTSGLLWVASTDSSPSDTPKASSPASQYLLLESCADEYSSIGSVATPLHNGNGRPHALSV
jgi:hypothetical protein